MILKLLPIIFFSVFLNTKDALGSSEKNTFVIDDQTKISFSIPREKFRYSEEISESIEFVDFKNINFNTLSDFSGFDSFKYYVTKIQLQNTTNTIKKISSEEENKIRRLSIAPLIAEAVKRIDNYSSVSSLFN